MSDTTTEKPKLIVKTGPFDNVIILGHNSVEERDREAGKVGSTLEDADYSDIYRSTLPEIHDKAAKEFETITSVLRSTNEAQTAKNQQRADAAATKASKPTKPVTPVKETFVEFAKRLQATVTPEVWKSLDTKFREIALATPVDASPTKRLGAPSKAAQEKAADILSRDSAGIEAAIEKLETLVPDFDLERDADGKPEQMSLARFVKAYLVAREMQEQSAL